MKKPKAEPKVEPKPEPKVEPKKQSLCVVRKIESANPKKRERKEKDTIFEFDAGGFMLHGVKENLESEGGIDAFLMKVADARECNGLPRNDDKMRTALMEALNG